jgi:hypothetical protein
VSTDDSDAPALRFAVCPMAGRSEIPRYFADKDEAADWVQSNGGRGWIEEPLEVVSLQSCVGSIFQGKRVLEWLPRDQIAAPQVLTSEAVTARLVEVGLQELGGETAWPACCLDLDWKFEEIEREARKLEGHNYAGRDYFSLREVVWRALGDFDVVLVSRHPSASASAIAHFWRSWQIYRHVMGFCGEKLANSVAAAAFAFGWENTSEAGQFALRQLSSYARTISMAPDQASGAIPGQMAEASPDVGETLASGHRSKVPEPANVAPQVLNPGKRRGRPPDHQRRDAIHTAVNKYGDEWREHLEEIFSELNNQEVPLRDFQGMTIDLGECKSARAQTWTDLDLIEGDQRKQIIDTLRKYAD